MKILRIILAVMFVTIATYTAITASSEGWGLIPVFLGDLLSLTWRGQFNLDFALYLMLSALWVAWRGGFTPAAFALAGCASVLGMVFFAPYVLWLSYRAEGDIKQLLLGRHTL